MLRSQRAQASSHGAAASITQSSEPAKETLKQPLPEKDPPGEPVESQIAETTQAFAKLEIEQPEPEIVRRVGTKGN